MSELSIVCASAGSGKTTRITQEYLKLLFGETDNFRHILAVTFTNKATEEMKSRIIGELYKLASKQKSKYLEFLITHTGFQEKTIRNKSDTILKKILHDYSRFSVSTIDSFFQRIIRSFTREIGIQSGFTIELDTDNVLEEAIDRLFLDTDSNLSLREWLIKFAVDRTEEGRSWNFKKEILELGKQIFKEEFREFDDIISEKLKNKKFLDSYLSNLYKIKAHFENTVEQKGIEGLELISSHSLSVNDFSYKETGPAGYFLKLANRNFQKPGSRILEAANSPEKWYSQSSEMKNRIVEILEKGLNNLLVSILDFFNMNYKYYRTSLTILSNIYTLGILSDITREIFQYISEKNIFLLSDASAFLNKIIENNDAPFIYEKTGNYYHHFMIDEFQDTSGFQWNNFKPLIDNSISQNYDNLVVGDAKQSIYRWRSTNWEILTEKVFNDFYPGSVKKYPLEKNWRSYKNIIDFNNSVFVRAARVLQNYFNSELSEFNVHPDAEKLKNDIVNIYSDIRQQCATSENKDKGYIKIQFTDNKEDNFLKDNLVSILNELQDKGYKLKDIAVLTRKKEEGKDIADFLIEYKKNNKTEGKYRYDVVSDESLYLSSSSAVKFLISLLKFFINENDAINIYYIISEYLNYIKANTGDNEIILGEYITADYRTLFKEVFQESFIETADYLKSLSLYEMVERLIEMFSLNNIMGELPFIQAFQDMILDYSNRNSSNIYTFLEYWEDIGYKKSISISEAQDAIRIMTIHKSKGLEFKAIIIPYCNWRIDHHANKQILWCKPSGKPFDKLDIVPVNYSQNLKETVFAGEYYTEKIKSYVVNLNLLYVAFTRAGHALYCICDAGSKAGGRISTVSDLLFNILSNDYKSKELSKDDVNLLSFDDYYSKTHQVFEYGDLENIKPEEDYDKYTVNKIDEYTAVDSRKKLRIAYQVSDFFVRDTEIKTRPLNYGKIMHEIFAGIVTIDDLERAVEKVYNDGKIGLAEKESILRDIEQIINNNQIRGWFSKDWKVFNEKDIILPDGSVRRPDRVLVKGNSAAIVDYKFGAVERREYMDQVREYETLLKEMGYDSIESYVWYISTGKIVRA
ncbi:MAG: UvrD-helicase domain-containing protein [Bacteroidales bacterium]|nr:MAG: UvrD-helicase domain-containing protein [Bacteroidales bacterium]